MGPKKQNHDFTKNGSKVNVCNYRDFSKWNYLAGIFRKVMMRPLVAETHVWESMCIGFAFVFI
jgi:hypothetical protein